MRIDERAARMMRLLEYVNEQDRPVPVSELAELAGREFGVSEVTLRSDLAALCALSGIRKLARGTYEAGRDGRGPTLLGGSLFGTRLQHRAEAKIAIAGAAARILAGQPDLRVLLLDAGTTTFYVADRLSEQPGLDVMVWTPNVAAASRLAGSRGVSVRLLGGEFHADYATVSGDETARALRALAGRPTSADEVAMALPPFPGTHCVLDVNSVSPEGRLFTDESQERLQKRLMADLAQDLTLVADCSKLFLPRLGLQAHEIYALEQFSGKRSVSLVTDEGASGAQRGQLQVLFEEAFPGREVRVREEEGAVVYTAARPG